MSIVAVLLLVFSTTTVYAAEGDIVDVASGIDDFSILVAAASEAGLVSALQGDGPLTVFAPTNEAFATLLSDLGIEAADLLAHPQLADVLLYHVVAGKVMSSDLTDGLMADTLLGEKVTFDLSNGGAKVNSSNIISPDVEATNGVIHVIDSVLVPSTFELDYGMEETMDDMMTDMDIVDVALGNEDFSMLVALLQQENLVTTLQGDGPFTVFAPTNQAFADLLDALGITAAELMAQPELSSVLLYHVVPGKVMSTDIASVPKVNPSNIVSADIAATNGVVHVIDSVLIPEDFTLEAVIFNEEIPKTGDIGMIPFVVMGLASMTGALALRKKKIKW